MVKDFTIIVTRGPDVGGMKCTVLLKMVINFNNLIYYVNSIYFCYFWFMINVIILVYVHRYCY